MEGGWTVGAGRPGARTVVSPWKETDAHPVKTRSTDLRRTLIGSSSSASLDMVPRDLEGPGRDGRELCRVG